MATITSQKENHYIFDLIKRSEYKYVYFGYSGSDEEGEWRWINGEISRYENWHDNEPNAENNNEDFAIFYWKYDDGS